MNAFETMLVVTTATGLVTGLGAIPVLLGARVSHRVYDAGLGLAGGIMVAASVFGLIIPGLEEGTLSAVMTGVFLGGIVLLGGNYAIPHLHAQYRKWLPEGGATDDDVESMPTSEDGSGMTADDPFPEASADAAGDTGDAASEFTADADDEEATAAAAAAREVTLRKALLIGGAITLHNAPEGLAIGVAGALLALLYAASSDLRLPHSLRERAMTVASRPGYGDLLAVGAVVAVGYPVVGFPADPAGGGSVVNLYVHLLGFCLGFIGPFALLAGGAFDE